MAHGSDCPIMVFGSNADWNRAHRSDCVSYSRHGPSGCRASHYSVRRALKQIVPRIIQTVKMAPGHRMAADELNSCWKAASRRGAYLTLGAPGIGHYGPGPDKFAISFQELEYGPNRSR